MEISMNQADRRNIMALVARLQWGAQLPDSYQRRQDAANVRGEIQDILLRSEKEEIELRRSLTSISKNTCCNTCQEAALVARSALSATGDAVDMLTPGDSKYILGLVERFAFYEGRAASAGARGDDGEFYRYQDRAASTKAQIQDILHALEGTINLPDKATREPDTRGEAPPITDRR
jgi:hypothetical protein